MHLFSNTGTHTSGSWCIYGGCLHEMKCLDLFSGIGGMGRLLPVETIMYCEWDAFPRSVLQRRMKQGDLNNVPIHEDVRTLDPPDHDILIGGFPCQDISSAGKKLGFEGKKSCLYYEVLRIIKKKHPPVVFLENVAHILVMPGVWKAVLTTLSQEGYDMAWGIFSANMCGAFHQRNRWFILAKRKREPNDKIPVMPDKMHKYGTCVDAVYEEVPDPLFERNRHPPITMRHIEGAPFKGKLHDQPIVRTLWSTPRATGGNRAIRNMSKRSMSDLPSMLRFADCTQHKHFQANINWVEQLMGLPAGWTDPEGDTEPFEGFEEQYQRMKPDKTQPLYYKRWKTLGNMCVSQTSLMAYKYLNKNV